MEHRAAVDTSSHKVPHPREGRNVWIITAYGITGLALFGVLAYYISTYVAR